MRTKTFIAFIALVPTLLQASMSTSPDPALNSGHYRHHNGYTDNDLNLSQPSPTPSTGMPHWDYYRDFSPLFDEDFESVSDDEESLGIGALMIHDADTLAFMCPSNSYRCGRLPDGRWKCCNRR